VIPRVAVVATHNRPAELARLLDAITPQCNKVFIIDNASTPPVCYPGGRLWGVGMDDPHCPGASLITRVEVIRDEEQPPNLSRLWNVGLDAAREYVRGGDYVGHDVAVLNDDAVPPPGWWDAVSGAMRLHGADAACADPFDRLPPGTSWELHADAPMAVTTRLAGWAMLLRGEWEGARFDERLRWWYQDDLISLRAREAGGLVHVGGFPVPNTGANTSTVGVLAEQAGRDRATFVEITGRQPW
jgi:hypothetical protein